LFSYPDTQRHRLGVNYALIPVNACPFHKGRIANYQRDGAMRVDTNGGSAPNYSPNGGHGPVAQPAAREAPVALGTTSTRSEYPTHTRADDFEQAGLLYRVMKPDEQARLVENLAGHLKGATPEVQRRQLGHFFKADAQYGERVAAALGLTVA